MIPFRVKVRGCAGKRNCVCRDRCRRKPDCPFRNAVRASGFAPARDFERQVGLRLHGSEDRARAVPHEAKVPLPVSALPLPALRGLIRYLDAYPYACAEQRINQAMPYALLMNRRTACRCGQGAGRGAQARQERMDEAISGHPVGAELAGRVPLARQGSPTCWSRPMPPISC